jgi:large subunit ribosomal protein L7e
MKKRRNVEQQETRYAAESKAYLEKKKKNAETAFKHAESYVNEYLQKERDEIRAKRVARDQGKFYVPEEAKLAFVVRIKG